MLNVTTWSSWQPWRPFSVDDITDPAVATVLGLLGLLLWLAAIETSAGHDHPQRRQIVLAAVTQLRPACLDAEGPGSEEPALVSRRRIRPVLMVMILGIGVQITTGVATAWPTRPSRRSAPHFPA
jgi:hypothetical protein